MVGFARSDMSDGDFRNKMREAVSEFSRTGLKDEQQGNSLPQRSITFAVIITNPAHTSVSRA